MLGGDGGPDVGEEITTRLAARTVLRDDPTGARTAAKLPHLPPEQGGFDIEGLDEFSSRDELTTVSVQIGTEVLDN